MTGKIVKVDAPAKINLSLQVLGRRADGYHELVSVVGKVEFGDEVEVWFQEEDSLEVVGGGVSEGADNLVMRALMELRKRVDIGSGVGVRLVKRIPVSAGLGGGSSDAVALLKGVNELMGGGIDKGILREVAEVVGSDCPLFLAEGMVVMRGRGEILSSEGLDKWRKYEGRRVMLFKPEYGVGTAWAYGEMSEYSDKGYAEECIAEGVMVNDFEGVVFAEHPELGEFLNKLRKKGYRCMMSGSGSSCFVMYEEGDEELAGLLRDEFGTGIFMIETFMR